MVVLKTHNCGVTLGEQQLLAEINRDRLVNFNANVAKEVRLSGSEEERRAFEYVQSQLDNFGFQTELFFSDAYISLPGAASLTVLAETFPCITHSMGVSVRQLEAPLVYGGSNLSKTDSRDLRGKIALIDGLAVPGVVKKAAEEGAVGVVFINAEYTHEMIISPVWGHPTPETILLLPKIPTVSVTKHVGDQLKCLLEQGNLVCALSTEVDTCIRQIPTLIAELQGTESPDDFLLFSGHIDSWHYGAMDNGSANALMLEIGRIFSKKRTELRRSLRLAFWSGHSHGRYAGSSWYCDHNWEELHEHCVLHVNVDSVGGVGSSILTEANCMAETKGIAASVIRDLLGQEFVGSRYGRSGDQSFWGPGVPSLFMGLSEQPSADNPAAKAFGDLFGGGKTGGFGWWWHTTEDTLDKVDPDCLVRDTEVYLLALHRFLTTPILPFGQYAASQEIVQALKNWQNIANGHIDLSRAIDRGEELTETLQYVESQLEQNSDETLGYNEINEILVALSRILVPLNYVKGSVFDHDLALSQSPVPKLEDIAQLATLEPGSMSYRVVKTSLVRKTNEIAFALKQAIALSKRMLAFVDRRESGAHGL